MPHDNNSNAPSTGRTSDSAPATPLSESKYLTQQAADAKAAISRTVDDLKRDLAQSVDPKAWMKVHPWATIGAAAVAGFVAAAVAIPSKEQRTLKRLAEIEKALMPKHYDPIAAATPNGDGVKKPTGGSSFLTGLAAQVLHAVQPVLMSAITAGVTAKTVQPEEPTGGTDPGQAAAGAGASQRPAGADPAI